MAPSWAPAFLGDHKQGLLIRLRPLFLVNCLVCLGLTAAAIALAACNRICERN